MNRLIKTSPPIWALASIVLVSVMTYATAVDNFFISDDFGLFTVIEAAQRNPRWFFESTTEFFRLMSYVYFAMCYHFFGLNPEPYYWAGIALHALVSVLVYFLVSQLTKSPLSAWAAALFFAVYERHQEAIMWISAANETILALSCLIFLLLWQHSAVSKNRLSFVLAHAVFAVALFSKEAAIVLMPIAAMQLMLFGYSFRDVIRKSTALVVMTIAFVALWLGVAQRNFFVTQGHYALGWQFIPVYVRSLTRLSAQLVPLIAVWAVVRYRQARLRAGNETSSVKEWSWKPAVVFFSALLVLAVAPYTFLTYLDHIPSRNTYLPSIGLAGLIGIWFAFLYDRMRTQRTQLLALSLLAMIITANVVYIWTRKEQQYRERAAPTRELIETLNAQKFQELPVRVCRFPLDAWTFTEAVTRFTPFKADQVILDSSCEANGVAVMQWDQRTAKYISGSPQVSAGPVDAAAAKH